jgi:hypothetical protein
MQGPFSGLILSIYVNKKPDPSHDTVSLTGTLSAALESCIRKLGNLCNANLFGSVSYKKIYTKFEIKDLLTVSRKLLTTSHQKTLSAYCTEEFVF